MKRDDLKEGMVIQESDGELYRIGKDGVIYELDSDSWWTSVYDYNEDLTYGDIHNDWGNIVKVYDARGLLLWVREGYIEDNDTTNDSMLTDYNLSELKDYYETSPVKFMEDYLGIKLTFWQKTMLSKVIDELGNNKC